MLHLCFTESSAALGFVSVVDSLECYTWKLFKSVWKEFNMTVITTVPNVSYHALPKGTKHYFDCKQPFDLPEPSRLDHVEEPFIKATYTKSDYVGNVMSLCIENVD
jgi:GTP-binding protein LepA